MNKWLEFLNIGIARRWNTAKLYSRKSDKEHQVFAAYVALFHVTRDKTKTN